MHERGLPGGPVFGNLPSKKKKKRKSQLQCTLEGTGVQSQSGNLDPQAEGATKP